MDPSAADVTTLLNRLADGDQEAAAQLVPLIYEELRRLAAFKMAGQLPGQTLQPTALVHEAWLRLVGSHTDPPPLWNGRGHFFAAAASCSCCSSDDTV